MASDQKNSLLFSSPTHKAYFQSLPLLLSVTSTKRKKRKKERNLIGLKSYNNITVTPYWPQEEQE